MAEAKATAAAVLGKITNSTILKSLGTLCEYDEPTGLACQALMRCKFLVRALDKGANTIKTPNSQGPRSRIWSPM